MRPRALVPPLLCALVLWPLHAIACINAMDDSYRDFSQSYWVDLIFWTVGAVFLHRVVLRNVWGPAAMGQPEPSRARRGFFLFVGVALVLLLETVSVAGPLLHFSASAISKCTVRRPLLAALVASPVLLFLLQAAFFHGPGRRLFGDKARVTLVGLVVTSVLLVLGMGMARETYLLPNLCQYPKPYFKQVYEY
ncbi:hypothetical protein [Corallococcus carmarthensis]|uniref:Uncharacterized protein n=1 Tax=Corallococcus carmarthensis TaxID=2316728 RepID=A0A3A8JUY5_9BACT|nr:hypothetical protein [Corallococcus carmarthensis]NOK15729.1 hypothetical protein [Corallococcus carmarthensis]RKG98758.1 hypothetical protein D7X32_28575 [Corallococcus carmarthensis]